jgi:hypothetical protein
MPGRKNAVKVSYSKELHERARQEGRGLITIEVTDANGCRSALQAVADERVIRYARRAYDHVLDLLTTNVSKFSAKAERK